MNFKKQARKIEEFLTDELQKKTPLLVISDTCMFYKKLKIKQGKDGSWQIWAGLNQVGKFNLKACATLAAKVFSQGNFRRFEEVKTLDSEYWRYTSDRDLFKKKLQKEKDGDRKDILEARFEHAKVKSQYCQKQITAMFKTAFDK